LRRMALFGRKDVASEISKVQNQLQGLRNNRDKNQAEAFRKRREAAYYRTLPKIPDWTDEKSVVIAGDLGRESLYKQD